MSMKGKGGRQRGYSVLEERDVTIAKALMFVVKRAVQKEEKEGKEDSEEGDDEETGEYLTADPEGWVTVADVVCAVTTPGLNTNCKMLTSEPCCSSPIPGSQP